MRFRGVASWAISLFRRYLQVRAVFSTVVISGIALAIVGGFLSYSIGGGLFSTRQAQVLAESERAVVEVQNTFSASSVSNEVALQSLMNTIVPSIESTGTTNSRRVALLRSPGQATGQILQSPISADLDPTVIPTALRSKVRASAGNLIYQSIALRVAGAEHPGIVVGAPVQIPLAGSYELYLVFDLNSEQQTLDFVAGAAGIRWTLGSQHVDTCQVVSGVTNAGLVPLRRRAGTFEIDSNVPTGQVASDAVVSAVAEEQIAVEEHGASAAFGLALVGPNVANLGIGENGFHLINPRSRA